MTDRQLGVKGFPGGFLNNKLDACVRKYLYGAYSVAVDQTVLTRARSNFSNKRVVKEMALDVAVWCKQLEVVVLLLVCLCSPVLLCPSGCECVRENQMIFAECYNRNSMTNILPASQQIPPLCELAISLFVL